MQACRRYVNMSPQQLLAAHRSPWRHIDILDASSASGSLAFAVDEDLKSPSFDKPNMGFRGFFRNASFED